MDTTTRRSPAAKGCTNEYIFENENEYETENENEYRTEGPGTTFYETEYETEQNIEHFKICNECKLYRPLSNFNKDKTKKDGLTLKCKECQSKYYRKWRTEINREGYNEYKRKYNSAPERKIQQSLRSRLCSLIQNHTENGKTMKYLGCPYNFFLAWLQYQFDKNMNWDNFGTYWHVDHTLPVSMFNHEDEESVRVCWNWKNLRPLEKIENIKKGNKIDWDLFIDQLYTAQKFKELYDTFLNNPK